ncbi:terpene synthase family protein [Actinomadura pelletieri DSM 43383]|uniref:Terpene synthase family protein n=1 Tax=Actinomadura pelletieri DSM 43383 TaxID=1120940 RepID=A0A495QG10_9ACTN|nr:terpene synthase family protein [Actinomadura pelletieri]RKS70850.1 terpene synthase family protein [Actinomadura pelletieri DSM 43383]
MTRPDALTEARDAGLVMARAVRCARDLADRAAAYPDLFDAKPIDETLFNAVACANAFGSPDLDAAGIRMAARTSLWIFGLDWLVDHVAAERSVVDDVNRRCLAVAAGGPPVPGDGLTRFLAEIRDDAAKSSAFEVLRDDWLAQLRRLLECGAREWTWKSGDRANWPTFDEYLDNADNYGSAWVNVSHWIVHADEGVLAHIGELQVVSREVQRVLRLLNDLATYERDMTWGDLNAQMLGVDRATITARIDEIVARCRELLRPLRADCPDAVAYLERQIGYSTGFYGLSDYWGSL